MMSTLADLLQTWRHPGQAFEGMLARDPSEARALATAIGGCLFLFVGQWPLLGERAESSGVDPEMILAGSMFACLFVMPLLLYGVAALTGLVLRVSGCPARFLAVRMVLFQSLLASGPLAIAYGILGATGPKTVQTMAGVAWVAVFGWFWLSGLWRAREP